jgi:hypothetical protein
MFPVIEKGYSPTTMMKLDRVRQGTSKSTRRVSTDKDGRESKGRSWKNGGANFLVRFRG